MLEQAIPPPVPVDFFVAQKTHVLIITGPNTGGKTICLKTVGLAAMMAKSGLFNFKIFAFYHLIFRISSLLMNQNPLILQS